MTKKLGFQLAISFSFKIFVTQPYLIAWSIVLWLDTFIIGLILKLLYVMEVLLTIDHQISELGK